MEQFEIIVEYWLVKEVLEKFKYSNNIRSNNKEETSWRTCCNSYKNLTDLRRMIKCLAMLCFSYTSSLFGCNNKWCCIHFVWPSKLLLNVFSLLVLLGKVLGIHAVSLAKETCFLRTLGTDSFFLRESKPCPLDQRAVTRLPLFHEVFTLFKT